MSKVYDWFEERLEIQSIADDISSKYVPPHVNIFYCLGGITLTCFLVQVATGFAMTFYYRPTVTEAFASVQYIMTDVNFGWLIRSVHRWSASMMVLMMILHVCRVYLTGGFKKPRELTWVTGVVLASLTVSFGVTGYSLPWDQVGYWAVKIVTGVPDAIPVVGQFIVELLRGSVQKLASPPHFEHPVHSLCDIGGVHARMVRVRGHIIVLDEGQPLPHRDRIEAKMGDKIPVATTVSRQNKGIRG